MPLALTVKEHWDDGKKIHVVGSLVASGNYAAGGDTVNFQVQDIKSTKVPDYVEVHGRGAYAYSFVPGTTQANGKVKAMVMNTGVEVAAGAYPAGVTADVIDLYAIFPKFR